MIKQAIVAKAIKALERKGRVTPSAVVEAARNKKHPLHSAFPWDDKIAAHQRRLDIARHLIVSVEFVTVERPIKSICYVRDPHAPPKQQGYVSMAVLKNDTAYAQDALDAEIRRVESMLLRARDLTSTLGLDFELDEALKALMVLHSRLGRKKAPVFAEAAE